MTHGRSSLPARQPCGWRPGGPGARQRRPLMGAGARGRRRGGRPGPGCAIEPGGRGYRRPDKRPLGIDRVKEDAIAAGQQKSFIIGFFVASPEIRIHAKARSPDDRRTILATPF